MKVRKTEPIRPDDNRGKMAMEVKFQTGMYRKKR